MQGWSIAWASKALAWSAHLLTAGGAVFGFLSLLAIEEQRFRDALVWMGVAFLIDLVDGHFARLVKVGERLPRFDGLAVGSIVNYFTHCILPAYFLYRAGLVPAEVGFVAAALILALTPYRFGNLDIKTEDHYFQGFPGWWNLLVFYLYVFAVPPEASFALVLILCLLLFLPLKYVYPSRAVEGRSLQQSTMAVLLVANAVVLARLPHPPEIALWLSLLSLGMLAGVGLERTFMPRSAPPSTGLEAAARSRQ